MTMNNKQNVEHESPQQTEQEQNWLSSLLTPENIELFVKLGVKFGPKAISALAAVMTPELLRALTSGMAAGVAKAAPGPAWMMNMFFGKH